MADSDSSNFEKGVNIASTQKLNFSLPGTLPPIVQQNYSLNKFEDAMEFNARIYELGNLLAQGANGPQNRVRGADALRARAENISFENTHRQVMFTQMMYEMKTQMETDQRPYEADDGSHEADQRCYEEQM